MSQQLLTRMSAAFVERIVGRGLSIFGTGGGAAAVCGAAASADIEDGGGICSVGITGGRSGSRGERWLSLLRKADMNALRAMIVEAMDGVLHAENCKR